MDAAAQLLDLTRDVTSDLDVDLPHELDPDVESSLPQDLHHKLKAIFPEDGKNYLAQLGVGHYDLGSLEPGKYYDNVPLDQNPEANFDDLTRESIRRKSRKSPGDLLVDLEDVLPPGDGVDSAGYEDLDVSVQQAAAHALSIKQTKHAPRASTSSTDGLPPSPRRVSFRQDVSHREGSSANQTVVEVEVHMPPHRSSHSPPKKQPPHNPGTQAHQRRRVARPRIPLGQDPKGSDVATDYILRSCDHIQQDYGQGRLESNSGLGQIPDSSTSPPGKGRRFKFPSLERLRQKKGPQKSSEEFILAYEPPEDLGNLDRRPSLTGSQTESASSSPRSDTKTHSEPKKNISKDRPTLNDQSFAYKILPTRKDMKSGPKSPRRGAEKRLSSSREVKSRHTPVEPPSVPTGQRAMPVFEFVSVEPEAVPSSVAQLHLPQPSGAFLVAAQGSVDDMKQALSGLPRDEVLRMRDEQGNNLLHLSTSAANMACVEYLGGTFSELLALDNKAKLTPVATAIKHGRVDVLDWLLESGSGVDRQLKPSVRRSLLHHAAKFGQDGCLRLLLSRLEASGRLGPMLDQSGNSPAHLAAKYGHLACLQTLVEFGLDVSAENKHGHTPCFYADFNNQRACAGYLMVVETCAKLAQDLAVSNQAGDRLAEEAEQLQGCLAQTVSTTKELVDVTKEGEESQKSLHSLLQDYRHLTQSLTNQLQDLFSENCALRQRFNGTNGAKQGTALYRQDVERSLETAHRVRERHSHLPPPRSPSHHPHSMLQEMHHHLAAQAAHQGALHNEQAPSRKGHHGPHRDEQAGVTMGKNIMRERLSEALQRLVVFRTSVKDVTHLRTSMASPDGTTIPVVPSGSVSDASSASTARCSVSSASEGADGCRSGMTGQSPTMVGGSPVIPTANQPVIPSTSLPPQPPTLCSNCLQNIAVKSESLNKDAAAGSSSTATFRTSPEHSDSTHQFMASTPCAVYSNLPLPGSLPPTSPVSLTAGPWTVSEGLHSNNFAGYNSASDSDAVQHVVSKRTPTSMLPNQNGNNPNHENQEALSSQVSHSDRDTSDSDSQKAVLTRPGGRLRSKHHRPHPLISASVSDSALYMQNSGMFYTDNQDNYSMSTPVIPKKLDISPKDFRETYQRPLVLKPRHDILSSQLHYIPASLSPTERGTKSDGGSDSDANVSGKLSAKLHRVLPPNTDGAMQETMDVKESQPVPTFDKSLTRKIAVQNSHASSMSSKVSMETVAYPSPFLEASMSVSSSGVADNSLVPTGRSEHMSVVPSDAGESMSIAPLGLVESSSSQEDLIPCKMARGAFNEEAANQHMASKECESTTDTASDTASPVPKPFQTRPAPAFQTVVVTSPGALMAQSTPTQCIPKSFSQDFSRDMSGSPGYILQPIQVSAREAAQPLHVARSNSNFHADMKSLHQSLMGISGEHQASLGGMMVTFRRPDQGRHPIVMGQDLLQSSAILSMPTAEDLPAMFTSDEEWATDKSTTSMSDDEVLSPYEDDVIIGRQLVSGGLSRGLRFERRLPTIEEVSVKSESTRADEDLREISDVDDPGTDLELDQHHTSERGAVGRCDRHTTAHHQAAPAEDQKSAGHSRMQQGGGREHHRNSKAWYEMSDDEDSMSWQRKQRDEQTDHFTLF